MEASTKRMTARISWVPPGPCHGKCGDRIQSRSGIMTIRLIVMELGRFTACVPPTRRPGFTLLSHLCGLTCFKVLSSKARAGPFGPALVLKWDVSGSHPSGKSKDVANVHPSDEDLSLGTQRVGHPMWDQA